mmetsp:Transcript_5476/g.5907  ORF Transcript_5476/g.5907 Transcript_5476/m.5907 type:complete len:1006 (+) Transcript_5476:51-3068(+)
MEHGENELLISSERPPRPNTNYFYGSTTTTTVDTPINDDQDSLVGEGLISPDNEGELTTTDNKYQGELFICDDSQKRHTSATITAAATATLSRGIFASYPILVFLLTAGGCVSILPLLLISPQPQKVPPQTQKFTMPFPQVDRADFDDPIEGFIDMDLFHPTLILGDDDNTAATATASVGYGSSHSRSFVHPFPTGAFWTNLVVPTPEGDFWSYPTAVYPFAYRWSSSSLRVSYPAGHRVTESDRIQDVFTPELALTTKEEIKKRYIVEYDPLSVTLKYVSSPNSNWKTTLVQGSPYVTASYTKQTPILKPLSIFSDVLCPWDVYDDDSDHTHEKNEGGRRLDGFGICSIDESNPRYTTMRGAQFLLKTPEGVSWLMFASEPMNLVFDKITKTTVSSAAPFSGVIRLAYIPNDGIKKSFKSSTGFRRLIYHSDVYPVGGDISYQFHKSASASSPLYNSQNTELLTVDAASSRATLSFKFETRSMLSKTADPKKLLMLALPHHAVVMSQSNILNSKDFDVIYECIKGNMTPVVGSTSWSFDEPLYDMEFDSPIQAVNDSIKHLILEQVEDDLAQVLPNLSENVYGYGKQVARLAQLAHIADQLEIKPSQGGNKNSAINEKESVLTKVREQLSKYLEAYLSSDVTDSLLFDINMGGICSTNGLRDKGEDFGNGRYNDHHFHYGYFLYASAVMAKIDPTFTDRFGANVDALFYDIAHSSNGNSRGIGSDSIFFPMSRHKSWFDGHSFATGMFPFGNGKSQESSSEAVNCYYGAYLWSLVRNEATDFSRLLLSTEIRSTKMYWHMLPSKVTVNNNTDSGSSSFGIHPHIYPSEFEKNYMVGNVGMLDVAANTWFGNDPLYVHMINAIPITAATRLLFDENYVKYEYPFLMNGRDSVEMAWRGYTVSIHSVINPNKAWEEARGLVSNQLDSALSKSQVLFFISQQPGFNVSLGISNHQGKESDSKTNLALSSVSTSSSSCESNPSCEKLSLTGDCCPTSEKVFLGCCSNK